MKEGTIGEQQNGERLGLEQGQMYRVSHTVGSPRDRRVTRSLAVYTGSTSRRRWDGRDVVCHEFERPRGRPLSLVGAQIVEIRPATLNERGKPVLVEGPGQPRRRLVRRLVPQGAW